MGNILKIIAALIISIYVGSVIKTDIDKKNYNKLLKIVMKNNNEYTKNKYNEFKY